MINRPFLVSIACEAVALLLVLPAQADLVSPCSNPTTAASSTAVSKPVPSNLTADEAEVGAAAGVAKPPGTAPAAPASFVTYTVAKGDSLTSIARKFNTTRRKLQSLNALASAKVKPGQMLIVGTARSSALREAAAAKAKARHEFAKAQPVQDFDIPASTFASCPVPLASPDDDVSPAIGTPASGADLDASASDDAITKPARIATLVSPAELAADEARQQRIQSRSGTPLAPTPVADVHPSPSQTSLSTIVSTKHTGRTTLPFASGAGGSLHFNSGRSAGTNSQAGEEPVPAPATSDWADRFLLQARLLGDQGIEYDDSWRPPGEAHAWAMDCSNTSRYLYKVTAGITLPRTASDQYYYLRQQGKAWDVPLATDGWPSGEFLRQNLKPGDLLFWENTYRPERQPPITHVMVFLGTNPQGQWIMAGSQSSHGGEHNRRNGGPDIYIFRPSQACGGYTTWMGMVRHKGRFCAFGRPLEADAAKLAVAAND